MLSLICISGLLALSAGEVRLDGSPRVYAGRTARLTLVAPELAAESPVRWKLRAFSAVIAEGEGRGPVLSIAVRPATRKIDASLDLTLPGGAAASLPLEIWPPGLGDLKAALPAGRLGVVGMAGALAELLTEAGASFDVLESPGAVRMYRGPLLLLAPGAGDVRPFLPAVLEKVRTGTPVLALGPDAAPWTDATAAAVVGEAESPLLADLGDRPLATWGRGGRALRSPLRPGDGNHVELLPGAVREGYLGAGKLVLSGLKLVEEVREEPLAQVLLSRLVARTLEAPPVLLRPSCIVAPKGMERDWPFTAFVAGDEGGPYVLPLPEPAPEGPAGKERGLLLVGAEKSVFLRGYDRREGPGASDRAAFTAFVTTCGVRLAAQTIWREP